MKKAIITICLPIVLAAGCSSDDNKGGTSLPASTTPHTADFNVDYPMTQARSTKRGICSNVRNPQFDIPTLSEGVGWYYNWSANVPTDNILALLRDFDMQFLPMTWNNSYNPEYIRIYKQLMPDAPYLLAYNEPNLTDQANMTPSQAAAKWGDIKALAKETGMKLISPAMNYGTLAGYSDPIKWMDEFLECDGVSLDDMYGIALHCYMPSVKALRDYIHLFEKYGKPIFLTEFCHATEIITNNETTQYRYLCDALNYLEIEPMVEGYAWFMDRASGDWAAVSLLNSSGSAPALTDMGKEYVYFSSFDTKKYYSIRQPIPAEHYSATSMTAAAAEAAPRVCPTTDETGILNLCDFYNVGSWVEYNVNIPVSGKFAIALRYNSSVRDSEFDISIDGKSVGVVILPKESVWKTLWLENVDISAGRHKLRLTLNDGRADFNWIYID